MRRNEPGSSVRGIPVRLGPLRGTARWIGLVVALLPASAVAQVPAAPSGRALEQMRSLMLEKLERTPAQQKLHSQLVLGLKRRRGDPWMAALPELRVQMQVRGDGRTLVDLTARVSGRLERRIRALGGQVVSAYPRWDRVRAWMPLDTLELLALDRDIRMVAPAERARTDVVSEGDRAHLASDARAAFGVDGSGVRVCVLSDGVDRLQEIQATGELPAVEVLPGRAGTGTEGTAMLEIIHDLAPGAELAFATGQGGQAAYAQSILELRSTGCDILVDDLHYLEEAVLQDGLVAAAVEVVTDDGAIYFSSAGNDGGLSRGTSGVWEGNFALAPVPVPDPIRTVLGNDVPQAVHAFGGLEIGNTILLDPPLGIGLTWADPFQGSAVDYDLFLLDSTLENVLAAGTSTQNGTQPPQEFIPSAQEDDSGARLVIVLFRGSARFLHMNTFGGVLDRATAGQTRGHSAVPAAVSVAASFAGQDPALPFPTGSVEPFSSDGPRRVFFSSRGSPLAPGPLLAPGGVVRAKPDLTAADGVRTTTPGFTRFFGTSAAAPHAAAIAALVLSARPDLTPAQLRLILTDSTLDLDAPGFDNDSGAGVMDALLAVTRADLGLPACRDTLDNDGDGLTDFPADPGCGGQAAATEAPSCNDALDNDDDGTIDLADTDCSVASSDAEACGMGGMQSAAVLPLMLYLARRRRPRTSTRR